MDKKELQILKAVEHNARMSLSEIAASTKIAEEEVRQTLNDLEEKRIICGYDTQINWDKTDKEIVTAIIEVKVTPQRGLGFDKIASRIYRFAEVDAVYLMSGGYDFMVLIEGKSMKEISRFVFEKLSTIEFVSSTTTHFVLKKYKDHGTQIEDVREDHREIGF